MGDRSLSGWASSVAVVQIAGRSGGLAACATRLSWPAATPLSQRTTPPPNSLGHARSMYAKDMRLTRAQVAVALAVLADPDGQHWGYDLSRTAGVSSGVLYPLLTRWLLADWLTDGWENPAQISGRPPRRYYRLTVEGRTALGQYVAAARADRRFIGPPWTRLWRSYPISQTAI